MSAADQKTIFEKMKVFVMETIFPVCSESLRLLPDSMVLGVAILAGLSMSKSMGVLLFTMFEFMLIQRVFSMIIGGIAPVGAGQNAMQGICQSGFIFPNQMRISLIETIGIPSMFPSPTIFFLSATLSYMLSAMQNFGREIKSLSGELKTRTNIAIALSFLFVLAMMMFRYSYGCESFGTLLLSIILGFITGSLIVHQNIVLFGRDGVNVLNIPMILSSIEKGKPMYVCAPSDI
ncbi:hypothetical protein EBV26_17360 [bacterium]|jgi:hypothetical protein|nr:hypothetical protein [bacterium]